MSTEISTTEEAKHHLDDVIAKLMTGERDPEEVRLACERMDRAREEIRRRIGTVEVAVDYIRELRDR
jgi:hypothetical protein